MWQEILTTIILSVVGVVISGVGAFVMAWIRTKIKDEKLAKIVDEAFFIVQDGVNYVYQTYVEGLKGTSLWDKAAMQTANQKAVDYIYKHLSQEAISYIISKGQNVDEWIAEQIEIAVKNSKDNRGDGK